MNFVMFLVEKDRIIQFTVEKELPKTYQVERDSAAAVFGSDRYIYLPRRISKDSCRLFSTLPEAISYYRAQQEDSIKWLEDELTEAKDKLNEFNAWAGKLAKSKYKLPRTKKGVNQ